MAPYARLTGWGMWVPERVMTNQELEAMVDTSDAWIRRRTGIGERRIAGSQDTAVTMGVAAGRRALEVAALSPQDLDLIIVATVTSERIFPACASQLQHALGASRAAAFDVNAACSGFIYALVTAYQFVLSGTCRRVLVVGTEVYSRILNWQDRSTCVLFGDGAGAVVVEAGPPPTDALSFVLGSDGAGADLLYVPGLCGAAGPFNQDGHHYLTMVGAEVFKFAIAATVAATQQALAAAQLDISQVDILIPHQANYRIITAAARALEIPSERVFMNLERYGNTSAASIPMALCEAIDQGRLKKGDHLVLVGFGGGLSWGAVALHWAGGRN
ncbi:MAG: ketoacyl-ACP synthase III [Chloroflexi bacterium]|nr:ketoacyl-ACP synthase III [Chloroflexota bacterium]